MTSAPGVLPRLTKKSSTASPVVTPTDLLPPAPTQPPATVRALPVPINLGGALVHLTAFEEALEIIMKRAGSEEKPLAVASANLDHIKHFGHGSQWSGALRRNGPVEWLTLLDGAPLVTQAERVTKVRWPRLAGSDLALPILAAAAENSLRVGFMGGLAATHDLVRGRLSQELGTLEVAGYWAPERQSLSDPGASEALAAAISAAGVDILFVCLGKPLQELWINNFGHLTGARVLLAFGATVDFLAGSVRRAPEPLRDAGLEWAWRLALEPKRLASRYLMDGPPAYARLRSFSGAEAKAPVRPEPLQPASPVVAGIPHSPAQKFTANGDAAQVAVLIVTYNSQDTLPLLVADLRRETGEQSIRVIVADNSPSTTTVDALSGQHDVDIFRTGGNLGYAAGINLAMRRAGSVDAFLVLNPDIRMEQGCVARMRTRMQQSGAGVVVPLLRDDDGSVYPSLRREPTVARAVGDAVLGSRIPERPGWLSEMDFHPDSYARAHQVDWATGAALLIDSRIARTVGDWDERYFLYSEETDFMRRVRRAGATVWFEPTARMAHSRGASGASAALNALMAANRVRYVRKFRPVSYARVFHAAVILSSLLRAPLPGNRGVLATVAHESRWSDLPHPDSELDPSLMPRGSVVIPAHNEAAVLARTLDHLAPYAAAGRLEVIVACNACEDGTEGIARRYPGVQVLELTEASKVAALNAADALATTWPRLYLDADIEIHPPALAALFSSLSVGRLLAARPDFIYDSRGAHWLVRSYYRARSRMPSQRTHLWGAGAYAVSAEGHTRFGCFPDLTADDLFVDSQFTSAEKTILTTKALVVRTPRTITGLNSILRRTYRGNAEQGGTIRVSGRLAELLATVNGPTSAMDAAVYTFFAVRARVPGRKAGTAVWERDDSSR
ncbi:exopolysaccharide biosynthesis WecB/TagA/CpsF family protein [Arthrobacter sp. SLBN-100]|uniref:WecB/TagA/CpsF family glycosyltransferase n=1 Tax=Arthrobacter sp. SLBN-100 TaxID=2768450 RepID=UPI00114D5AAA|nr:WecB/TagA/CpsF family glycosyltransferase [Arthrobacter sp. SLBN-100]TQJ68628.1 exopolysaccharide biosynthesis WecB/TagA/CpsF family protein [Arthrobacter sp. SLBN-100]